MNEKESTHNIELNTVKQELLDSKEERRIEKQKNEESLSQVHKQEQEKSAIALADQYLPRTYRNYWIFATITVLSVLACMYFVISWLCNQPDAVFSNGEIIASNVLISLLPILIEVLVGGGVIKFALCGLNKERIRNRLIERYTVK